MWMWLFLAASTSSMAQITERERPREWDQLVSGGRYADRFLPMPDGTQRQGIWGTDSVKCRFVDNGIESDTLSFWGGNILQSADGTYHLYVCGWPERSPKGHMFWPNSTVYHAVSRHLSGPYTIRHTIGKGHNPEAFRLSDGRVVIYVIDGYYIGDHEDASSWTRHQFTFNPRDRRIIEGLSNLTFAPRADGSRLMVCRGGGVWVSRDGLPAYNQLTDKRVYPPVKGEFEDPVLWRDSLQYHLIVNDWLGRIAFYERSLDGVHWVVEPGEAYMPGISRHKDGEVEYWFKYERPKVFQDRYGRVEQMNFAVIDTIKWEDLPGDRHSSKNICIPMNKGIRMEVLNKKQITASTSRIKVRILADENFNPHTDVDVASLRFGAFTEVNYGRGCKPVSSRKAGADLVVIFDGQGSGITLDEFAPKLIGRNSRGEMVFGYARLPYVDYKPAILSALRPRWEEGQSVIEVEVTNFGLSASKATRVEIRSDGRLLAEGKLPALKPYGSHTLSLTSSSPLPSGKASCQVCFLQKGRQADCNDFPAK